MKCQNCEDSGFIAHSVEPSTAILSNKKEFKELLIPCRCNPIQEELAKISIPVMVCCNNKNGNFSGQFDVLRIDVDAIEIKLEDWCMHEKTRDRSSLMEF